MLKKVSSFLPFFVALFIFFLIIKLLNLSYPVTVTSYTSSAELAVSGEGKVEVRPDTALINVGVSVNNLRTVEEVQKSMDATNAKIMEALTKLKINKADIKTSNYSIFPYYSQDGSITGYNGSVNMDVKLRNTGAVSQVVQAATTAGANQVNSIQFSVDNPDKYRQEARQKAIQNARDQAKVLAKELGIQIGRVVNMVEANDGQVNPYADARGLGGGAGSEVSPGTQTISSVVTLYFEKK